MSGIANLEDPAKTFKKMTDRGNENVISSLVWDFQCCKKTPVSAGKRPILFASGDRLCVLSAAGDLKRRNKDKRNLECFCQGLFFCSPCPASTFCSRNQRISFTYRLLILKPCVAAAEWRQACHVLSLPWLTLFANWRQCQVSSANFYIFLYATEQIIEYNTDSVTRRRSITGKTERGSLETKDLFDSLRKLDLPKSTNLSGL